MITNNELKAKLKAILEQLETVDGEAPVLVRIDVLDEEHCLSDITVKAVDGDEVQLTIESYFSD